MEAEAKRKSSVGGSAPHKHSMAAEDPDMWILEYGLFHDLDQVTAQIKQNVDKARIDAVPTLFRRMTLNGLCGTLKNAAKVGEWHRWLTVFANCNPADSGPDSRHHALLNEYKAQVVLQPLQRVESPDIEGFLERRKLYLPFTSSATSGEAAFAKEMADLAQRIKPRSAKPAEVRRAIRAVLAEHPLEEFQQEILEYVAQIKKERSPRPFLYQVYEDIVTGRYTPSPASTPFSMQELRAAFNDDERWRAIVDQTDPEVEAFLERRAAKSGEQGQQPAGKTPATVEKTRHAKAAGEATKIKQEVKGKAKRQIEEEEEEDEAEAEAEEPEKTKTKPKGKEGKKAQQGTKSKRKRQIEEEEEAEEEEVPVKTKPKAKGKAKRQIEEEEEDEAEAEAEEAEEEEVPVKTKPKVKGKEDKQVKAQQSTKGKGKRQAEEEEDGEEEEEPAKTKPKANGDTRAQQSTKGKAKENKKAQQSTKGASTLVQDLRTKTQVLGERARKGDPLPGLLAREKTTTSSSSSSSKASAAAASLHEPMMLDRGYDDEAEDGYDSADEAEKKTSSKLDQTKPGTTTGTSKRQFAERHPSATRLTWSEDESPLPTRDKQEVTRTARDVAAKRRRMFSESDSDVASGSDDDNGRGKKAKKDPFEFKAPNERARSGGRRKKRYWTDEEIELLLEGVRTHGVGKWAKILSEYEFAAGRTSVDLKDKYRNLLRLQAKEESKRRETKLPAGKGKEQPGEKRKSKDSEEEEEEEVEEVEEEDDSTTTNGSQGRHGEEQLQEAKERDGSGKENGDRDQDEEEGEGEEETRLDTTSKSASPYKSPRAVVAKQQQTPSGGSRPASAVASKKRKITAEETEKPKPHQDRSDAELMDEEDDGEAGEKTVTTEKKNGKEEQEKVAQKRIAKRKARGRAQSIALSSLAAASNGGKEDDDDDRITSSAPPALSASSRGRRASAVVPRRTDELEYSD